MPQFPFNFFENFIVRIPLYSYKEFQNLYSEKHLDNEKIYNLLKSEIFKETIYIASPSLHQQLINWETTGFPSSQKQHQKLKNTFLKYINRMSTRSTPFGLFSGVALGDFNDQKNILPREFSDWEKVRDTKFDMHFLVSLSKHLASNSNIKKHLLFFPNNTVYKVGNNVRYIEYENNDGKRDYIISSAPLSDELKQMLIFSQNGKTITELTSELVGDDHSIIDVGEYIEELIDNQVLISELEPNVSGKDFLDQILLVLNRIDATHESSILIEIKEKLEQIDTNFGNPSTLYAEIEEQIKSLKVEYDSKYLFQTDLYFENKIKLSSEWKKEFKKGISFLNKITAYNDKESNLEKFKQSFSNRFEGQEISLSLALDTEIGIGYLQDRKTIGIHPYIDDLDLPSSKNQDLTIKLNPTQFILNQKIQKAYIERDYIIKLVAEDFKDFEENWNDLSNTMSFMAEIISENDKEKLFLNSVSGNAGRLLGRFCSEKASIKNLVKEISRKEQELNSNQILAEIIHLPESRIGNILRRPKTRDYEIPYLAKSLLPEENQIPVEDLVISIKNDKLILRSKRLNKEIIPHLTNAHNYSINSLPIYNLLCDLSFQGIKSSLYFDWGGLMDIYIFLPRVEFDNIILSKARWKIDKKEVEMLISILNKKESFVEVENWRKKRQIPKWIQWIKQDNTLLVNLENEDLLKMFLFSIKNEEIIIIEEFLCNEKDKFIHQFIFPIYKNTSN